MKKALGDTKRHSGLFLSEIRNYFTVKSSVWVCFPSESIINVYPVKIYGLPKNILHVKIHSKKNYVNSRVNIAHKFHIFLLNNMEEIATNLQLYCKTSVS